MLLYDISSRDSFDVIEQNLYEFSKQHLPQIGFQYLVGNKADLESQRVV